MQVNAAVVSLENPDKIVWSGTWVDCSKFIRNNTWLYGSGLYIRQYSDGVLGSASSAYLWDTPVEYDDLEEIPTECVEEVVTPTFEQPITSGEVELMMACFLATVE